MKPVSNAPDSNQSVALQLIYPDKLGIFALIAQTIGRHGGDLGRIDTLGPSAKLTTRGISVRVRDEQHLEEIVTAVRNLDKVKVVDISEPGSRIRRTRKTPANRSLRRRKRTHC